jgi:hypothetical protein
MKTVEIPQNITKKLTWTEYKGMPAGLRKEYLKRCIDIGASATDVANMFGKCRSTIMLEAKNLSVKFPYKNRANAFDNFVAGNTLEVRRPENGSLIFTDTTLRNALNAAVALIPDQVLLKKITITWEN